MTEYWGGKKKPLDFITDNFVDIYECVFFE